MRKFILIIMTFVCWATLNAQHITVKMTGSSVSVCPLSTNTYTLPDIIIDEGKADNFKSEGGAFVSQDVVIKLPSGYTFSSNVADAPTIEVLPDVANGGGNDIQVYSTPYTIFSSSSKIAISIFDRNPPSTNIPTTKYDKIRIRGLKLVTTGSLSGNIEVDLSTPSSGLQTDGSYVRTSDNGNITDIQVGIINITPAPAPVTFQYYTAVTTTTADDCGCRPIPGCTIDPCIANPSLCNPCGGDPFCQLRTELLKAAVSVIPSIKRATSIINSAKVVASVTPEATCPAICDINQCEESYVITPGTTTTNLNLIGADVCPGTQIYVKIAVGGSGETNPVADNIQRQLIINGTPLNSTVCPDGTNGCFALNNLVSTDVLQAQLTTGAGCTYTITPTVSNPPVQNIPIGVLKVKDLSYDVPLRVDPDDIEPDSIMVFGNFENTEFRFKDGTTDIPKTDYNFNSNPAFSPDASNEAWLLNPAGLNLDFVYTVGFRDLRCGNTLKYFKFKLFDNSPKQLIGISNGGVCKDLALTSPSGDVKIGWIGQGAVGFLSCIEDDPAGGADYIGGTLAGSYRTTKGVESGFYIKRSAINASTGTPTVPTTFDVIITYYVCPGTNVPTSTSLTPCTTGLVSNGQDCIIKTTKERITISDPALEQITILGADPNIKPAYCQGSPSITLVGTPTSAESGAVKQFFIQELTSASLPTGPNRPLTTTTTLEFRGFTVGEAPATNPNILEPGKTYRISYTYTNKYGCGKTATHDIFVEPLPAAIASTTPTTRMFCLNSPPITNVKVVGHETDIVRWYTASGSFLYEDQGDPVIGFSPIINTAISADYDYQVSIVSSSPQKCESAKIPFRISVGEPIIPDFSFTKVCEGNNVQFTNESNLPNPAAPDRNQVERHDWDFGDDPSLPTNTSTLESPTHTYQNPGIYTVRYTIFTKAGCSNSVEKRVIVHKEAVLNNGIYYEDFENVNVSNPQFPGQLDWTSSVSTELLNKDSKNSSWKVQNISGTTRKGFKTSNGSNTYNNSEYSWIESPCFNLALLDKPLLNITLKYNTDNKADGIFVMYTVDNGNTWKKLGNNSSGAEWYNETNILGLPSTIDPILAYPIPDDKRQGWSGGNIEGDFVDAKISLQDIKTELGNDPNKRVRFRIVFASNSDNPVRLPGQEFLGVIIDRVVISNKNHRVLLEHFTNTTAPAHQDADWASFANNTSIDKSDLVHVQYHTTFPTGDALGQASRPESNARSLHYAVGQPPYTVVDGRMEAGKQLYPSWKWNPTGGSEAYNYYLQRSLVASTFSIGTPTFSGGTGGNPLQVKVNISRTNAPSDKTSAVMAHLMIVQNDVNGNKNVVRRMLPSPAGTRLESMWASGSSYTLEGSWKPSNAVAANTYSVVVFIADEKTKEIYQADIFPINQNIDAKTVEKSVTMDAEEINLYPNPTSTDVTVVLPETPTGKVTWRMFDALGREVEGGSGTTDNALFRVTTQNCNKGIYIIEISTSDWKVRKSVSVIK